LWMIGGAAGVLVVRAEQAPAFILPEETRTKQTSNSSAIRAATAFDGFSSALQNVKRPTS
jgi:hypothetical protein